MAVFAVVRAIAALFSIFELLILISVLASWLPFLWDNKTLAGILRMINSLTEPLLKPVRSLLSKTPAGDLPVDFSPVITIVLIGMLEKIVVNLILAVM